jgi:hypothetical protein
MSFQVSPGVAVKEKDLTNVIPAVSTSIGALAGDFDSGPMEEIITVTSESDLVEAFGKPTNTSYIGFFQASSFLKYGNALRVVRSARTGALNATADETGLLIKNLSVYEEDFEDGQANVGTWAAKTPGIWGNSLKVSTCPAISSQFDGWAYKSEFDTTPGTSDYVSQRGGANDEIHIIVIDEDGLITGTPGTILEKFAYVSVARGAKRADGGNNYYSNVINNQSDYIYFMDHTPTVTEAGSDASTGFTAGVIETVSLAGGVAGNPSTTGELVTAGDLFSDSETSDVNLLIAPVDANDETVMGAAAIALAEGRRDLVVFISPPLADTVNVSNTSTATSNVKGYFDSLASSSYAFSDSTAVKIYDKYNDLYRWIPANGHTAGLCAFTDNVADTWFSPGGFNRGQLLGITKVAFNPKKANRDDLYKARINPIVSFPGEGTILYGDKTMLARPSAFDRINVRRLFITMEKAIALAAKFQLFELNDEFTRAQFRNMIEPFLRDIKGRRGITDFKVICDNTNNTGQVIDTNNFVADIYVKPTRSINFITLNFIATRTGVEFSEIVGQ